MHYLKDFSELEYREFKQGDTFVIIDGENNFERTYLLQYIEGNKLYKFEVIPMINGEGSCLQFEGCYYVKQRIQINDNQE